MEKASHSTSENSNELISQYWESWDDHCMAIALDEGEKSEDPNTKVGACISNKENKILGRGHNHMPKQCENAPWEREGEKIKSKYLYVCHAAMDAIMNCIGQHSLKGSTMYCKMLPCSDCAKLILKAEIARVVYICEKPGKNYDIQASKVLFDMAGIRYGEIRTKNLILQEKFDKFKEKAARVALADAKEQKLPS